MPEETAAYLAHLRSTLARAGWVIQASNPTDERPSIHNTLGLWPHAGFEIITLGLDLDDGVLVLSDLCERVQGGLRLTHGQVLDDVVTGGFAVTMLQVSDSTSWLPLAHALYSDAPAPIPAWQMVYPDATHRMPWEANYAQPLLGPRPT